MFNFKYEVQLTNGGERGEHENKTRESATRKVNIEWRGRKGLKLRLSLNPGNIVALRSYIQRASSCNKMRSTLPPLESRGTCSSAKNLIKWGLNS